MKFFIVGKHDQVLLVAPFVGAWIEMTICTMASRSECVAPFVGAWIEILEKTAVVVTSESLPSWERGLKFAFRVIRNSVTCRSLRGSERGLKSSKARQIGQAVPVAPFVGAWIEIGR